MAYDVEATGCIPAIFSDGYEKKLREMDVWHSGCVNNVQEQEQEVRSHWSVGRKGLKIVVITRDVPNDHLLPGYSSTVSSTKKGSYSMKNKSRLSYSLWLTILQSG